MYRVLHLVILCKNEQEDLVNMYSQILPYLFTYNYIYGTSIAWNSTLVLFFQKLFNRENNAETVFDSGQEIYITVGVRKPVF